MTRKNWRKMAENQQKQEKDCRKKMTVMEKNTGKI